MILTAMPDLPPRPETAANAAFRRWYLARWGRENAVVCGRTTQAEYPPHTQTLSIKTAWSGRERYFLPHREVVVDDDNYLILNEGLTYSSLLATRRPTESFSVFFRPGMQGEVQAARRQSLDGALARPDAPARAAGFSEHLRRHDRVVSAQLRALRDQVLAGERSEDWLEEQLLLLLDAMLAAESAAAARVERLQAARASTRHELARRLRLAADLIESAHTEPLSLAQLAEAACLSRYHFVRHFRELYGMTPHATLTAKRVRCARRLMQGGETDSERIALLSGFGNRWALQRALRRPPAADAH
jgi:AraC-like DNA-binding protein